MTEYAVDYLARVGLRALSGEDVGLESVPLVSFGPRGCGILHAGRAWQFPVESRGGDYYRRWGDIRPMDSLR